jgi:hypothetical protein
MEKYQGSEDNEDYVGRVTCVHTAIQQTQRHKTAYTDRTGISKNKIFNLQALFFDESKNGKARQIADSKKNTGGAERLNTRYHKGSG